MKILLSVFLLVFAGIASAVPVNISFVSGDGTAVSSTGSIYVVNPHPLWGPPPAGALWVSAFDNTGYGEGVTLPNSDGVTPSYTFTQTFILPFSQNEGIGTFGADDTMGVWLNGQLVKAPNFVGDGACAGPDPIGCEQGEFLVDTLLSQYLVQGQNTLIMEVYQLGLNVTGATWKAEFSSANPVPEPTTLVMLGFGLLGLAFAHRGQKRE